MHSLSAATQKTTQRNLDASLEDSERQCYVHGLSASTTNGIQETRGHLFGRARMALSSGFFSRSLTSPLALALFTYDASSNE